MSKVLWIGGIISALLVIWRVGVYVQQYGWLDIVSVVLIGAMLLFVGSLAYWGWSQDVKH